MSFFALISLRPRSKVHSFFNILDAVQPAVHHVALRTQLDRQLSNLIRKLQCLTWRVARIGLWVYVEQLKETNGANEQCALALLRAPAVQRALTDAIRERLQASARKAHETLRSELTTMLAAPFAGREVRLHADAVLKFFGDLRDEDVQAALKPPCAFDMECNGKIFVVAVVFCLLS